MGRYQSCVTAGQPPAPEPTIISYSANPPQPQVPPQRTTIPPPAATPQSTALPQQINSEGCIAPPLVCLEIRHNEM